MNNTTRQYVKITGGKPYWTSDRTFPNRVLTEIGNVFPLSARHILDIGCSHGQTTAELAKLNPNSRIIGLDINPELIEEANRILSSFPHYEARLKFLVGDGYAIKNALKDEAVKTFGAIFLMNNLAYVTDEMDFNCLRRIFTGLKDSLEEGGKLFISGGSYLNLGQYEYIHYCITFEKQRDLLLPIDKFFGYSGCEWPSGFHNKLFAAAANEDFSGESIAHGHMRELALRTMDINPDILLANANSPFGLLGFPVKIIFI